MSPLTAVGSAVPSGFEDITTEETAPIDFYYNGDFLCSYIANFDDDFLVLKSPRKLLEELDFIDNKDEILSVLKESLEPNTHLICTEIDRRKCKGIKPDQIGLILDRNKYSATLYINYKYLKPAEVPKIKYLENSNAPPGAAIKTSVFLKSVYVDKVKTNVTSNNLLSYSSGNNSFRVLSTLVVESKVRGQSSSTPVFKIHNVINTYRAHDMLYSFGTVSSNGSFLIPSQNVLGFSFKTDNTLIENPDIQYGTPISVNVSEPSVIEVLRDNVIIYSIFYTPGNYYLDTRSFASGAYNIVIKKTTLYGKSAESKRVFIKKMDFAPIGQPQYEILAGLAPDKNGVGPGVFPTYKYKAIGKINCNVRVSKLNDVEFTTVSDISYTASALEISHFDKHYQVTFGAIAATDGGLGASVLGKIGGSKHFSLTMQVRHIYDKKGDADPKQLFNPLDMMQQTQTNFALGEAAFYYSNSLHANFEYNKYSKSPKDYKYSLTYSRPIFKKSRLSGDLSVTTSWSEDGPSAYLTFDFALDSKKSSHLLTLYADRNSEYSETKTGVNYKSNYNVTKSLDLGLVGNIKNDSTNTITGQIKYKPLNLTAQTTRLQRNKLKATYLTSGSINGDWGGIYSLNNGFSLTSEMPYNSGAFLQVKSESNDTEFKVIINSDREQIIKANRKYFISLPAFRRHKIAIIPKNEDRVFKMSDMPSSLLFYPDNIIPITVSAKEYFVLITTILDRNGSPIINATIEVDDEIDSNTDELGEAQIEVSQGSKYKVISENEEVCYISIPNQDVDDGLMMLDSIPCTKATS